MDADGVLRDCRGATGARSETAAADGADGGGPGDRRYVRDLTNGGVSWTYHYMDGGNVVLPNGWESEEWNTVTY